MKFRQIEAFRAVMLLGTTSAAATELHISQPAISRLINDLEGSLNFSLFQRRKGRLQPTADAADFFAAVEESFLGFEKLQSVAEQIRQKVPNQLRISCTSSIGSSLLPMAIKEHKKYYPNERFTLFTDNVAQSITKLQCGSVDLALGLELPQLIGIKTESIGLARYVFVARKDHPLAAKQSIRAEDLMGESVLTVVDEKSSYWEKISDSLASVKHKINQDIMIDTSHTGYAMIASGIAVGVIEPFAARLWSNNDIITREFLPSIKYSYGLAFPVGSREHPSLQAFCESVRQVASTMHEFK